MERNSYLVSKSFKSYMIPAVLSMMALQLNTVVDGIIMGQLLGADAFSAINVAQPVIMMVTMTGMLFTAGPAVRLAKFLGAMEKKKASEVFTISVTSMFVFYSILSLLMFTFDITPFVASVLHVDPAIVPYMQAFTRTILCGALILGFQTGLPLLTDVMGYPKIITIATVLNAVTNLILDITTIKVFGMGIEGAALATLAGGIVSTVVLGRFIYRSKIVTLTSCTAWFRDFFEGISYSLADIVGVITLSLLSMVLNYFVMKNEGAAGMFAMSIGYSFISLGTMVGNAVGMCYSALGALLVGQGDYKGMRLLFSRGMLFALAGPVIFFVASLFFSDTVAEIFGAEDAEIFAMTARALPLISIILFPMQIVYSTVYLHTSLGYTLISAIESLSVFFSLIFALFTADSFFPNENIWYAFPIGTVLCFLTFFSAVTIIKFRSKDDLQWISLIPKTDLNNNVLDLSFECEKAETDSAIRELLAFLKKNNVGEIENPIMHTLEELIINILAHSGEGKGVFADLSVVITEKNVVAYLKNYGIPFDPTNTEEKNKAFGLKMVSRYSEKMEYQYAYGQNVVMAAWERGNELNGTLTH